MSTITRAAAADLDDLAPLFDAYRQFYGQPSDLALASDFLGRRLEARDSVVLLARDEAGGALGFTQLYPTFTSLGCARIFVLNDLFVAEQARGRGMGKALLAAAADFARDAGAARLTLSTDVANRAAQALYERVGWVRNDDFLTYNLRL